MTTSSTSSWREYCEEWRQIGVFDTTICDDNLGNAIIMEGVWRSLNEMFPGAFFLRLPYLDSIGGEALAHASRCHHLFLGGTNALSSRMEEYSQWGINSANVPKLNNVVLCGVGWWQYQDGISDYTKALLRLALHPSALHSVRDGYTAAKLAEAGFDNVIVTGCPSYWYIGDDVLASVPRAKGENVLLTLTYYAKHALDAHLVDCLRRRYKRVFLWIQGPGDLEYARSLGGGFEVVWPSLEALDALLESDLSLDCVGTRLHAGIRALAKGRRTIIIGVDNRAAEMSASFALPVLPRSDIASLDAVLDRPYELGLRIPRHEIDRWKSQFLAKELRP